MDQRKEKIKELEKPKKKKNFPKIDHLTSDWTNQF